MCNQKSIVIKKYVKLLVVILILLVVGTSCVSGTTRVYQPDQNQNTSGFTTFTSPDEAAFHLLFEYPQTWGAGYRSYEYFGTADVALSSITSEQELTQGKRNGIEIRMSYTSDNTAVEKAIQNEISALKWNFLYQRNFFLRTKRKVIVDNTMGWEIIMTYRERKMLGVYAYPPAFMVARSVFLQNDGILYHMYFYADEDSYSQMKDGFEHILNTFTIIK